MKNYYNGSKPKRTFLDDDYDKYECPLCGSYNTLIKTVKNEYADADGNRGITVNYIECMDCGYEE